MEHGYYNMDCMEGMRQFPDDYFSLAIVDPPYFSGPNKRGYYGHSLIACHRMGFEYVGFEKNAKHYQASFDRLEREKSQYTFFDFGMERKYE